MILFVKFIKVFIILFAVLILFLFGLPGTTSIVRSNFPFDQNSQTRLENSSFPDAHIIGQLGGANNAIFVSGNMTYIGIGHQLVILDTSDVSSPTLIGQSGVNPGIIEGIFVQDNLAYLIDNQGNLITIDVLDSSNPVFLYILQLPVNHDANFFILESLEVNSTHAFVAEREGLYPQPDLCNVFMINIENPQGQFLEGQYSQEGFCSGLHIEGSLLYLAASHNGLQIVDVSDIQIPNLIGSTLMPKNAYGHVGYAIDVDVSHPYAYVAYNGQSPASGNFVVYDISNTQNIQELGVFTQISHEVKTINKLGDYGTITVHGWNVDALNGIVFMDVSNPEEPVLANSYNHAGFPMDHTVINHHVYYADAETGLKILDYSDIENIILSGTYDEDVGGAVNFNTFGDRVYLARQDSGMSIVDVGDPTNPYTIADYSPPGSVFGVDVAGMNAYVTFSENGGLSGFDVVDMSQLPVLNRIGRYEVDHSVWDVELGDNYAYIHTSSGMEVIDITNPENPVFQGTCCEKGPLGILQLIDGTLYMIQEFGGLSIIDVNDPTNPLELGFFSACQATDFFIEHPYAYVTDGNMGLIVIDIADPENPLFVYDFDVDRSHGVWIDGDILYFTSGYRLYLMETTNEY